MRREQLGELVSLTSLVPVQRRTAEMPAVELLDLLRRDRELDAAPPELPDRSGTIERSEPCELEICRAPRQLAHGTPRELAAATVTLRTSRPTAVGLVLGCLVAFAGGFGLTLPLWW